MTSYHMTKAFALCLFLFHSLQGMDGEGKKCFNAYFFINTTEVVDDVPQNDDHNFSATEALAEQLFNKKTDFIFFPYSMLTIIHQHFQQAKKVLSTYGITDPLEQTIIENRGKYYPSKLYSFEPTDPLSMQSTQNEFGMREVVYKKAALVMHPQAVEDKFSSTLSKDTYRHFLLKTITNKEFSLDVERYYKLFLGLKLNLWRLFDTAIGLYCLTSLDQHKDCPILLKHFIEIPDLEQAETKKDSNEWTAKLDSLFNCSSKAYWSMYIHGHGQEDFSEEATIAGLPGKKLANVLTFFNDNLAVHHVTFFSCYTNTERLHNVLKKYTPLSSLNYTLLAPSSKKDTARKMIPALQHYYPRWFKVRNHIKLIDNSTVLKIVPSALKENYDDQTLLTFICRYSRDHAHSFHPFSILPAHTQEHLTFDNKKVLENYLKEHQSQ